MTTPSTSQLFSLNWTDVWKGIRGSLIVFVALFTLGGLEAVQESFESGQSFNMGSLDVLRPLVGSAMSFVIEEVRRFFTTYR